MNRLRELLDAEPHWVVGRNERAVSDWMWKHREAIADLIDAAAEMDRCGELSGYGPAVDVQNALRELGVEKP